MCVIVHEGAEQENTHNYDPFYTFTTQVNRLYKLYLGHYNICIVYSVLCMAVLDYFKLLQV